MAFARLSKCGRGESLVSIDYPLCHARSGGKHRTNSSKMIDDFDLTEKRHLLLFEDELP